MSPTTVHDGRQPPKQTDSKLQYNEFLTVIWGGQIPKNSTELVSAVELLYVEFKHNYLNKNEWLACARTAVLPVDPSEQQTIKEQLMALYLSASGSKSLSNKERENFAEAWIHAAEARRAVAEGLGDAAQAHLDGAYTLLAANINSQARQKRTRNKTNGRQECIEEFAKLLQSERPPGGWTDHSHVAKTLDGNLAKILDEKSRQYGSLWKKAPAVLIIEWLAKNKGSLHEAYLSGSV